MRFFVIPCLLAATACGSSKDGNGTAGKPAADSSLAAAEDCYAPQNDAWCAMAKRIHALTNEKRKGDGLAALRFHAGWSYVAQSWSQSMADVKKISHDGFPNARLSAYASAFGTNGQPRLGAENVGRIEIGSDDVEKMAFEFVDGWWKSPAHHANMVGAYAYLGVGIVKGKDGIYYATQIFASQP